MWLIVILLLKSSVSIAVISPQSSTDGVLIYVERLEIGRAHIGVVE